MRKRKRPIGNSWRMEEAYIKSKWQMVYLYRAVDSYGNTIESLLREYRDAIAAKAFFLKSFKNNEIPVSKGASNTCSLNSFNKKQPVEQKIEIRQNKYLNNIIGQDHRFIKKRTKLCLGLKTFNPQNYYYWNRKH